MLLNSGSSSLQSTRTPLPRKLLPTSLLPVEEEELSKSQKRDIEEAQKAQSQEFAVIIENSFYASSDPRFQVSHLAPIHEQPLMTAREKNDLLKFNESQLQGSLPNSLDVQALCKSISAALLFGVSTENCKFPMEQYQLLKRALMSPEYLRWLHQRIVRLQKEYQIDAPYIMSFERMVFLLLKNVISLRDQPQSPELYFGNIHRMDPDLEGVRQGFTFVTRTRYHDFSHDTFHKILEYDLASSSEILIINLNSEQIDLRLSNEEIPAYERLRKAANHNFSPTLSQLLFEVPPAMEMELEYLGFLLRSPAALKRIGDRFSNGPSRIITWNRLVELLQFRIVFLREHLDASHELYIPPEHYRESHQNGCFCDRALDTIGTGWIYCFLAPTTGISRGCNLLHKNCVMDLICDLNDPQVQSETMRNINGLVYLCRRCTQYQDRINVLENTGRYEFVFNSEKNGSLYRPRSTASPQSKLQTLLALSHFNTYCVEMSVPIRDIIYNTLQKTHEWPRPLSAVKYYETRESYFGRITGRSQTRCSSICHQFFFSKTYAYMWVHCGFIDCTMSMHKICLKDSASPNVPEVLYCENHLPPECKLVKNKGKQSYILDPTLQMPCHEHCVLNKQGLFDKSCRSSPLHQLRLSQLPVDSAPASCMLCYPSELYHHACLTYGSTMSNAGSTSAVGKEFKFPLCPTHCAKVIRQQIADPDKGGTRGECGLISMNYITDENLDHMAFSEDPSTSMLKKERFDSPDGNADFEGDNISQTVPVRTSAESGTPQGAHSLSNSRGLSIGATTLTDARPSQAPIQHTRQSVLVIDTMYQNVPENASTVDANQLRFQMFLKRDHNVFTVSPAETTDRWHRHFQCTPDYLLPENTIEELKTAVSDVSDAEYGFKKIFLDFISPDSMIHTPDSDVATRIMNLLSQLSEDQLLTSSTEVWLPNTHALFSVRSTIQSMLDEIGTIVEQKENSPPLFFYLSLEKGHEWQEDTDDAWHEFSPQHVNVVEQYDAAFSRLHPFHPFLRLHFQTVKDGACLAKYQHSWMVLSKITTVPPHFPENGITSTCNMRRFSWLYSDMVKVQGPLKVCIRLAPSLCRTGQPSQLGLFARDGVNIPEGEHICFYGGLRFEKSDFEKITGRKHVYYHSNQEVAFDGSAYRTLFRDFIPQSTQELEALEGVSSWPLHRSQLSHSEIEEFEFCGLGFMANDCGENEPNAEFVEVAVTSHEVDPHVVLRALKPICGNQQILVIYSHWQRPSVQEDGITEPAGKRAQPSEDGDSESDSDYVKPEEEELEEKKSPRPKRGAANVSRSKTAENFKQLSMSQKKYYQYQSQRKSDPIVKSLAMEQSEEAADTQHRPSHRTSSRVSLPKKTSSTATAQPSKILARTHSHSSLQPHSPTNDEELARAISDSLETENKRKGRVERATTQLMRDAGYDDEKKLQDVQDESWKKHELDTQQGLLNAAEAVKHIDALQTKLLEPTSESLVDKSSDSLLGKDLKKPTQRHLQQYVAAENLRQHLDTLLRYMSEHKNIHRPGECVTRDLRSPPTRDGTVFLLMDYEKSVINSDFPNLPVSQIQANRDGNCGAHSVLLTAFADIYLGDVESGREVESGKIKAGDKENTRLLMLRKQEIRVRWVELIKKLKELKPGNNADPALVFFATQLAHDHSVNLQDLQDLLNEMERMSEQDAKWVASSMLSLSSFLYEMSFRFVWPAEEFPSGTQPQLGVNNTYSDYFSGLLAGTAGATQFYPTRERKEEGWIWENLRNPPQAVVLKLPNHWDALFPNRHLLFFFNHPLLPIGWVPSAAIPLTNWIGNRSFFLHYFIADNRKDKLDADGANGKEQGNRNASQAKIYIRPMDIIKYRNSRDEEVHGVVLAILMRGEKQGGKKYVRHLKDFLKSTLEAQIKSQPNASRKDLEGQHKNITKLILDEMVPSFKFAVQPMRVIFGAKDEDEELTNVMSNSKPEFKNGGYEWIDECENDQVIETVDWTDVISVVNEGKEYSDFFTEKAIDASTKRKPQTGYDLVDAQWIEHTNSRFAHWIHERILEEDALDGFMMQETFTEQGGIAQLPRVKLQIELNALSPQASHDFSNREHLRLWYQGIAANSRGYDIQKILRVLQWLKPANSTYRPYRTISHESYSIILKLDGGRFRHSHGPGHDLSVRQCRRLLRLYGYTQKLGTADPQVAENASEAEKKRVENENKELNTITCEIWDTKVSRSDSADPKIPRKTFILKKILQDFESFDITAKDANPAVPDWRTMTPQRIAEYRVAQQTPVNVIEIDLPKNTTPEPPPQPALSSKPLRDCLERLISSGVELEEKKEEPEKDDDNEDDDEQQDEEDVEEDEKQKNVAGIRSTDKKSANMKDEDSLAAANLKPPANGTFTPILIELKSLLISQERNPIQAKHFSGKKLKLNSGNPYNLLKNNWTICTEENPLYPFYRSIHAPKFAYQTAIKWVIALIRRFDPILYMLLDRRDESGNNLYYANPKHLSDLNAMFASKPREWRSSSKGQAALNKILNTNDLRALLRHNPAIDFFSEYKIEQHPLQELQQQPPHQTPKQPPPQQQTQRAFKLRSNILPPTQPPAATSFNPKTSTEDPRANRLKRRADALAKSAQKFTVTEQLQAEAGKKEDETMKQLGETPEEEQQRKRQRTERDKQRLKKIKEDEDRVMMDLASPPPTASSPAALTPTRNLSRSFNAFADPSFPQTRNPSKAHKIGESEEQRDPKKQKLNDEPQVNSQMSDFERLKAMMKQQAAQHAAQQATMVAQLNAMQKMIEQQQHYSPLKENASDTSSSSSGAGLNVLGAAAAVAGTPNSEVGVPQPAAATTSPSRLPHEKLPAATPGAPPQQHQVQNPAAESESSETQELFEQFQQWNQRKKAQQLSQSQQLPQSQQLQPFQSIDHHAMHQSISLGSGDFPVRFAGVVEGMHIGDPAYLRGEPIRQALNSMHPQILQQLAHSSPTWRHAVQIMGGGGGTLVPRQRMAQDYLDQHGYQGAHGGSAAQMLQPYQQQPVFPNSTSSSSIYLPAMFRSKLDCTL